MRTCQIHGTRLAPDGLCPRCHARAANRAFTFTRPTNLPEETQWWEKAVEVTGSRVKHVRQANKPGKASQFRFGRAEL